MDRNMLIYIMLVVMIVLLAGNVYHYYEATTYYKKMVNILDDCQCQAFCNYLGQPNIISYFNYTKFCETYSNAAP